MVTCTCMFSGAEKTLASSEPLVRTSLRVVGPAWLRRALTWLRSRRAEPVRTPGTIRTWPIADQPADRELLRPLWRLLLTPEWLRTSHFSMSPAYSASPSVPVTRICTSCACIRLLRRSRTGTPVDSNWSLFAFRLVSESRVTSSW